MCLKRMIGIGLRRRPTGRQSLFFILDRLHRRLWGGASAVRVPTPVPAEQLRAERTRAHTTGLDDQQAANECADMKLKCFQRGIASSVSRQLLECQDDDAHGWYVVLDCQTAEVKIVSDQNALALGGVCQHARIGSARIKVVNPFHIQPCSAQVCHQARSQALVGDVAKLCGRRRHAGPL